MGQEILSDSKRYRYSMNPDTFGVLASAAKDTWEVQPSVERLPAGCEEEVLLQAAIMAIHQRDFQPSAILNHLHQLKQQASNLSEYAIYSRNSGVEVLTT